jgi:hypothetical protein
MRAEYGIRAFSMVPDMEVYAMSDTIYISPKAASRILGMSTPAVRILTARGSLPIGIELTAVLDMAAKRRSIECLVDESEVQGDENGELQAKGPANERGHPPIDI